MSDNTRQPPATSEVAIVAANTLFQRVVEIVNSAQDRVARTVNTAMVQTYWEIGRQIVLVEQQGDLRAGYGEQVLAQLSVRLTGRFGKGFSLPHLKRMRQFYQLYGPGPGLESALNDNEIQQIGSAVRSQSGKPSQHEFR